MFVSKDRPSRRTISFLVNRVARTQRAALCYGRFLQADPLGYEDNMNLYGYVGGDPVNNTDPSGMTTGSLIDNGQALCGSCSGYFEGMAPGSYTNDIDRRQGTMSLPGRQLAARGSDGNWIQGGPVIYNLNQSGSSGGYFGSIGSISGSSYSQNGGEGEVIVTASLAIPRALGRLGISPNWPSVIIDNVSGFPLGNGVPVPALMDANKLNQRVRDHLRTRKGSIRQAPLPPGSPGWSSIDDLTLKEIQDRAKQGQIGYKTIWKLLNDGRFVR